MEGVGEEGEGEVRSCGILLSFGGGGKGFWIRIRIREKGGGA